jgi:flagellar protein FlbD
MGLCESAATKAMIQLTRLNKHPIGVNSDLIKFIENAPDTMITLLTGEKILVRESFEEILDRIVAYRQRVLSGLDVMDYIANAKGPEIARLPGVSKSSAGVCDLEKGGKEAEDVAESEDPGKAG